VKLVIDASVAVKWLVVEDRHEIAREALDDRFELIAPDLLLVEVANALQKKLRAGLIAQAQATLALAALPGYFDALLPPAGVLALAFDIACRINHPVADCVYLACAKEAGVRLLTDDEKLYARSQRQEGVDVVLLRDWRPGETRLQP
jgi:predicted nucleic acid-binding protein